VSVPQPPRERDSVGTVEDLRESATRSCGLADFGEEEYVEPLQVLLDSYDRSAGLTGVGNATQRGFLRGALAARLLSEAAFGRQPEHAEVPVERPLFVTGLQRSGTTALQRLLHAPPDAQGLEMWLTQVPQPRPPRETWADDPVFTMLDAAFRQHHETNPELAGIHYMRADTVEECWQLLRQSVTTEAYVYLAHVPEYAAWLRTADRVPSYRRYRRNLQLIGLHDTDKRWVLKNPSHLGALPALLEVFPDALVVQCHRDPVESVASACSLAATSTAGWSTAFVGEQIGADVLAQQAHEAGAFAEARAAASTGAFVDVDYPDLVADPVGVVRRIHRELDLPWDEVTRAAVEADLAASRSGPRAPQHDYSLADYGLTESEVRAAF
jgi:hypothetical protein